MKILSALASLICCWSGIAALVYAAYRTNETFGYAAAGVAAILLGAVFSYGIKGKK